MLVWSMGLLILSARAEMIYLHPETVKELRIYIDKNSTGSGALFRKNEAAQETGINSIQNNYNF